jgi:cyclophilin family peptidyl-prolyl cis-trans isomerase
MMEPVTIETNIGEFTVELYYQHAPKTCFNFIELVKIGIVECSSYCDSSLCFTYRRLL